MRRRTIIGKSKGGILTPGTGFKMQIQTTTANETFTLPTRSGYTYNATVLWGDGTYSQVTGHNVNNVKTYATAGTYDIEIKGTFDSIYFNNTGSNLLVKKILSWGGADFDGFKNMEKSFAGCQYLIELAVGGIKEKSGSQITNFDVAFSSCVSLTTLPIDLFRYNTAVTNFVTTFNNCLSLTTLPIDLFRYNTAVTNFSYTFNNCPSLTSLPADLFRYNTAVTNFSGTFRDCNSLTPLPTDLFRYNTAVTNFSQTFQNCSSLTTLPDTLFQYNTAVTDFSYTFYYCTSLTTLPTDLFRYNTAVTNFNYTFQYCSNLTSLPDTLFQYNTAVTNFSSTFGSCSKLTSLPTDLFRYNTAVTSFNGTFFSCFALTTLPTDLFRYNTAVTNFSSTFFYCSKLQLRSDIFGATPDFGTRVMNFSSCFNRTSFTGTQGTAPTLWNATMNASSTTTSCFRGAGNSATSLTNYGSIPTAWKE